MLTGISRPSMFIGSSSGGIKADFFLWRKKMISAIIIASKTRHAITIPAIPPFDSDVSLPTAPGIGTNGAEAVKLVEPEKCSVLVNISVFENTFVLEKNFDLEKYFDWVNSFDIDKSLDWEKRLDKENFPDCVNPTVKENSTDGENISVGPKNWLSLKITDLEK